MRRRGLPDLRLDFDSPKEKALERIQLGHCFNRISSVDFATVKRNCVATYPSLLIYPEFSFSLELESCILWRKRRNWYTARRDWQHRNGPKGSGSATAMNAVIGRESTGLSGMACL